MASARPRSAAHRFPSWAGSGRPIAVLAVAASAALGLGLATAGPATAAPVADDPPAAGDSVVLIVHAAGDAADVRATAADAASTTVDVRHTFPADHAFSVRVAARDRAGAEAALRATPGVTGIEAPVTRTLSAVPATPNDPDYRREQAYLASVDAPAAWAVTHGSRSVRIAVIDTGIDASHPDLAAKLAGSYNADQPGTPITDTVGHGTFVAGVAAAATDNTVGIAGAGYDTSLLGVKIADADGDLSIDDEIAGINWAVAHGANVINLSLGGTEYSRTERAAVENAISKGVVVVAAAGNDGDTTVQYPAAYPGVIAVGAIDTAARKRASFSSHGSWVTLAAPGVDIFSTTPVKGSDYFPGRSGYAAADGTSFSSPLVAGAAALLEAQDPQATGAQLRRALVASAHGFAGQGLGAGQVDFAAAFAHLPPTTTPRAVRTAGTAGRITLAADADAPAVEFRVDAGAWTAPVAVQGGQATAGWDSWGYANATHTLHARACTPYGECGASEATGTFSLQNAQPVVDGPDAGSTSTGRFAVTASLTGGGARLLIDGRVAGFDASSPYSFPVNGTQLSDGPHQVRVVSCTATGALCAGPSSPTRTISTRSLHPVITGLAGTPISPNGDRVRDTATLRFTLPDDETVAVQTVDARGSVVRTDALGALHAGRHTWTWRGLARGGARLRDGRYRIGLNVAAATSSGPVAGYTDTAGVVDTVAPRLSHVTGNGTTFYPVHDGYRDTFTPGVTSGEAGTVALTIRSGRGAVVRALTSYRRAGRTTLSWNGRDAHGRIVAAGRYRWQYSVTDAAGNRGVAAAGRVTVSAKRLVRQVSYVEHRGATYRGAGGSASCASARQRGSTFRHGIVLRNACSPDSGDFAYAAYGFTLPHAVRYLGLTFQADGRSARRPSEISAGVDRTDGGLEIPAYVTVSRAGVHWHSIASVPASGHVNGARRVYATIVLTGRYRGTNDFDLEFARVRVSYLALR